MYEGFVAIRAIHLGSCLLLFALDAFAILMFGNTRDRMWWRRRILFFAAFALLILSGVAWFLFATVSMTDPPLTLAGLRLVWWRTHLGRVWQLRSIVATASVALQFVSGRKWFNGVSIFVSATLLASLACAGHGQLGDWRNVHLTNDVIHLLVAGVWPMGLIPLIIVLAGSSLPPSDAAGLLTRFSHCSVASVFILTVTGIVNAILTLQHRADLIQTRYGVVLIAKVLVVGVMIGIGSLNRRDVHRRENSNVPRRIAVEIVLTVFVLSLTAWLGTLEP